MSHASRPSAVPLLLGALLAAALLLVPAGLAEAKGKPAGKGKAPGVSLLVGGGTTLAPDGGTLAILGSKGISVAPLPATRTSPAGFTFPITTGFVDLANLSGDIRHVGGLRLSANGRSLDLRRFTIALGDAPALTAAIGRDRTAIATLDLGAAGIDLAGRRLVVSDVGVDLPGAVLGVVNSALGLTGDRALPTGGPVRLGTATVRTTVVR
jgi:hypothetical protein